MVALQALHNVRHAQYFRVQTLQRQKQYGEVSCVRRLDVLFLDGARFSTHAQFEGFAGGIRCGFVAVFQRAVQALVILFGKLGVDGQPHHLLRIGGLAGQPDGKLHAVFRARYGGHVLGILLGREHLLQQRAELHFTPRAARLHIGEHALQVTHAAGERLHFP